MDESLLKMTGRDLEGGERATVGVRHLHPAPGTLYPALSTLHPAIYCLPRSALRRAW